VARIKNQRAEMRQKMSKLPERKEKKEKHGRMPPKTAESRNLGNICASMWLALVKSDAKERKPSASKQLLWSTQLRDGSRSSNQKLKQLTWSRMKQKLHGFQDTHGQWESHRIMFSCVFGEFADQSVDSQPGLWCKVRGVKGVWIKHAVRFWSWYSLFASSHSQHVGQGKSVIAQASGGIDLQVYPACDQTARACDIR
jgi:hypothetical protein